MAIVSNSDGCSHTVLMTHKAMDPSMYTLIRDPSDWGNGNDCGFAWQSYEEHESVATEVGVHYVDVPVGKDEEAPLAFTFYWPARDTWEGANYEIEIAR